MMAYDIITRADAFAEIAHAAVGQVRKYTNEPYIVHPREVAKLVAGYLHLPHAPGLFDQVVAAALLHDVVEDTKITLDLIEDHFGPTVRRLVSDVTDISKPEDGNRAIRKAKDREHTARATSLAKVIKLADMIDNTRSIIKHDKNFAKVYLAEKRLLLQGPLDGSASPALFTLAWQTLENAEKQLASVT